MTKMGKTAKLRQVFFLLTLFFFSANALQAKDLGEKTGSVKGKVTTNDNKAAAGVSVVIKNSNKGTNTNDDGSFVFNKLNIGEYTLQISLTGYETIEQQVTVEENQTASLSIQLTISDKQLQDVIITSDKNRLAAKQSNYVARMPLKNLENPQVYSVVNAKMIE